MGALARVLDEIICRCLIILSAVNSTLRDNSGAEAVISFGRPHLLNHPHGISLAVSWRTRQWVPTKNIPNPSKKTRRSRNNAIKGLASSRAMKRCKAPFATTKSLPINSVSLLATKFGSLQGLGRSFSGEVATRRD